MELQQLKLCVYAGDGQGKVEVFPETDHGFFLKVIDAQIASETDSQGKTTSLVLHQGGDHPARRIQ